MGLFWNSTKNYPLRACIRARYFSDEKVLFKYIFKALKLSKDDRMFLKRLFMDDGDVSVNVSQKEMILLLTYSEKCKMFKASQHPFLSNVDDETRRQIK